MDDVDAVFPKEADLRPQLRERRPYRIRADAPVIGKLRPVERTDDGDAAVAEQPRQLATGMLDEDQRVDEGAVDAAPKDEHTKMAAANHLRPEERRVGDEGGRR